MEKIDATVIGAGIVGLSVGARLSSPQRLVAVLEKNPRHGQETSSRNSEVIHAGIYYTPGSLKARLCVRGKELIYAYCQKHSVPCRRTGKIVAAADEAEAALLPALVELGKKNGVNDLTLLDSKRVSELEPDIKAAAGIDSPSTGIFSADLFMDSLARELEENGGMLLTKTECIGVEKAEGGYVVKTDSQEPFFSRIVVNCAGHNAPKISSLCGVDASGYAQKFVKGEYFRVNSRHKISRLIYPLPGDLSVGAHLTPDLEGRIRVGPSAFEVASVDYNVDENHADFFLGAVRRYIPDVSASQLCPDTAGVRPKLAAGKHADFVISHEEKKGFPGLVNLAGIDSPGLTAAPAIAEYVEGLLSGIL